MIEIKSLFKTYGEGKVKVAAAKEVSFSAPEGKLFTLLGPSGCGKSTTLRCVAGLETPEKGIIRIGRQTVYSSEDNIFVPAYKRDIGMVFQSYAIWPHLSVFDNVAYPLKIKKIPARKIKEKVKEALCIVGLENLSSRLAPQLSGGQQQRVALARALVKEPKVLLLDEPLSNLDAKLREQMRMEIKDLQEKMKITMLYVTHDQTEAIAISDIIAVMDRGTIVDLGNPQDIYNKPRNKFTADFIGQTNVLRGLFEGKEGDLVKVSTDIGNLFCSTQGNAQITKDLLIFIRPENLTVYREEQVSLDNVYKGTVDSYNFLGEYAECFILSKNIKLKARVHPSCFLRKKDIVYFRIDPETTICMPKNQS